MCRVVEDAWPTTSSGLLRSAGRIRRSSPLRQRHSVGILVVDYDGGLHLITHPPTMAAELIHTNFR